MRSYNIVKNDNGKITSIKHVSFQGRQWRVADRERPQPAEDNSISVSHEDARAFSLLFLVLLFRPHAIFGEKVSEKA